MTAVTVREATSADVADILRIADRGWTAAYGDILSAETIETAIHEWYDRETTRELVERDDVAYFVAERDGSVVGYVSGGPAGNARLATLGAIYVDPDCWGEGIGTALLHEFEAFCRRRDYEAIQFRVLSDNDVGMSFYRTHGYSVVEERETELFGEPVAECVLRGALE